MREGATCTPSAPGPGGVRRDVAQVGSASALGAEGRGFESRHPDRVQTTAERLPPSPARRRHTDPVLHLRISVPADLTSGVVDVLERAPAVSSLAVFDGASRRPVGDVVLADIAREAANGVLDELLELGVQREGTLKIEPVDTWVSRPGFDAEQLAPGSSADAVVWIDVTQTCVRRVGAELDLPELHVLRDAHRRDRHRARLADPRHRRDGPRAGVRARSPPSASRWSAAGSTCSGSRSGRSWSGSSSPSSSRAWRRSWPSSSAG